MEELSVFVESLPVWVIIAVVILALVEWVFIIAALVRLSRTPADRLTLSEHKWVWAVIILFANLNPVPLGAILFFVMGTKPEAAVAPAPSMPAADRAAAAADALYGAAPATTPVATQEAASATDGGGEQS